MERPKLIDIEQQILSLWPEISFDPTGVHGSHQRVAHYFVKAAGRVWGGAVDSWKMLAQVVDGANRMGGDAYVSLNYGVLPEGKLKLAADDITVMRHILIDVDPLEGEAGLGLAAVLQGLNTSTMTIIDSGRGMQAWVRVANNVELKGMRRQVEADTNYFLRKLGSKAMRVGCKVDTSCSDVSRVARLPGSVNSKNGKTARLVQVGTQAIFLSDFMRENHVELDPKAEKPKLDGDFTIVKIFPHLTDRAATFILDGAVEPGRHTAAYATAASLAEIGVPRELATVYVLQGAALSSPPLPERDALRAIDNAWRKHDGT